MIRRERRPCASCDGPIMRAGTEVRFCSRSCYAAAVRGKPLTPEQLVNRRPLIGEKHQHWQGADVSEKGGRARALRLFREIGPCVKCGNEKSERHHKDVDTANNDPSNIEALCRRCHMEADGRLESFRALAALNQPNAASARWRR